MIFEQSQNGTTPVRSVKSHRVFFSAAVRCKNANLSHADHIFHFGPSGAEKGAGFNFELWISLEGDIHSESGWILSEEEMHRLLWGQAAVFDHQSIHETIPEFRELNPTLENLAEFLFRNMKRTLNEMGISARLTRLRLCEGQKTWVDILVEETKETLLLTRAYSLQAVHRHHNPNLSWEENLSLYNKCSALHEHEYAIEVTVEGAADIQTELVMNRGKMDETVRKQVVEPYGLTYLNDMLGNTSGEVLTEKWSEALRAIWGSRFSYLVVRETRKNSFVEVERGASAALLLS
ncbi:MAG: 6-carboxytetrahydropterin synthase [Bdellovibrionales bacterium]|nr:6-carboxytetrahydropterin synthase [Bdellovibrionales bacterium]